MILIGVSIFLAVASILLAVQNNNAYVFTAFFAFCVLFYETVRSKPTSGYSMNMLRHTPPKLPLNGTIETLAVRNASEAVMVRISSKGFLEARVGDDEGYTLCNGNFSDGTTSVHVYNQMFWALGMSYGKSETRYSNDGRTWFTV